VLPEYFGADPIFPPALEAAQKNYSDCGSIYRLEDSLNLNEFIQFEIDVKHHLSAPVALLLGIVTSSGQFKAA